MVRLPVTAFLATSLTLLSVSQVLRAQSQRKNVPTRGPASAVDPAARQVADLLLAKERALSTGDPAAILQASRLLLAQLFRQEAKLRLSQGRGQEATDLYRSSLEMENSADTRLELASILLRTGKPQDAAAEAATVLTAEPSNASAWAVRGSALRMSGDERGAADALNRSLQFRSDANVAYALGSALLARHEKEHADQVFHQLIRASGNAAIWHVAVGDAYRVALYLEDAAEEFKKAIAIDPRVGHAEFFLGLTYLQMNQWGPDSRSFQHLREAVRLSPREYVSNFYLGALESTDGSDLASSDRHLHAAADTDPSSPEVWLYLGINASREKNMAAAKTYLRKAIALTGADEARNNYQVRRAYFALGRILIGEGEHAEGEALLAKFKHSEQLALNDSATVIAHAAGDETRAALEAVPVGKPTFPGMKTLDMSAGQADPAPASTASMPSAPAQTPEEKQRAAAAERQLGQLLASSLNDLGTAEARTGSYDAALGHFQQAEKWDTPTAGLLHNLGTAAFRLGNYSESARAFTLYFQRERDTGASSPQDDRAHMMLAMSQFSMGHFADADQSFNAASAVTLQDPRAAYSWAYSLAHSGKQQQANGIADVLAKQDLPPDVMSLVCHLYMDTENYEQSVGCFRKAYQADPTLKLAHYQVAESLIRLDRPAEALVELKQELSLNPDSPDVQYSFAFALLQTSHKEEATALLTQITTAHPSHVQAQYQLGKILLEEGKAAEAVGHLETAEQNDPAPDYIHYQLQTAYRKLGRTADADREARIYREMKSKNRDLAPHPN